MDPRPPLHVVRRRENLERNARSDYVVPADDEVKDTLNEMLSLHLNHDDIASHLGVNRFWLRVCTIFNVILTIRFFSQFDHTI